MALFKEVGNELDLFADGELIGINFARGGLKVVVALEDVADELRVRVADLAAVVVAASLMPSDWASRRDEGQPVISRGGDLHDPPPGNPLRMKPWASAC